MLRVSANHVSPKHACKSLPVRIGETTYTSENGVEHHLFYAVIAGYGCSKNFRTPKDAVYGMLRDHACTEIEITGEYIPGERVEL